MSDVSLADRLLCAESGVDLGDYKRGNISDVDWVSLNNARTRLLNYKITIDDNSSASMEYIKNKSRILHKKGKCDMIIIDYLQLQEGDKKVNREQQVSDISRKSKLLSRDLNIPVIQLSQLNRSCEERSDKKPMLSDLRESGAIEQNADMVMFLYRPSVYGFTGEDGRDLSGEGMVIISKQREGSLGEVKYKHNKSLTNYYPYLSDYNNNSFEETDTPF
jgi:replicative DNA helicase